VSCLHTTERVSGNVIIRPSGVLKAGDRVAGHAHHFDHTTIVFSGSVRVEATLPDGRTLDRVFKAPDSFLVRADVGHAITALEDGTVYWCVYSHRTPQGEVAETYTGWDHAYQ
jgi:quercetin dioxygenase-like cupin family protein